MLAQLWVWIRTGGFGESYAFTIVMLDWPLHLLLQLLPDGTSFEYGSPFMYDLAGWLFNLAVVLAYGALGMGVAGMARAVVNHPDVWRGTDRARE